MHQSNPGALVRLCNVSLTDEPIFASACVVPRLHAVSFPIKYIIYLILLASSKFG